MGNSSPCPFLCLTERIYNVYLYTLSNSCVSSRCSRSISYRITYRYLSSIFCHLEYVILCVILRSRQTQKIVWRVLYIGPCVPCFQIKIYVSDRYVPHDYTRLHMTPHEYRSYICNNKIINLLQRKPIGFMWICDFISITNTNKRNLRIRYCNWENHIRGTCLTGFSLKRESLTMRGCGIVSSSTTSPPSKKKERVQEAKTKRSIPSIKLFHISRLSFMSFFIQSLSI